MPAQTAETLAFYCKGRAGAETRAEKLIHRKAELEVWTNHAAMVRPVSFKVSIRLARHAAHRRLSRVIPGAKKPMVARRRPLETQDERPTP
jgi:hypothetical protein